MEDRKVFYIDGVGMDSGDILQAAFDGKLRIHSPFLIIRSYMEME